MAGTPCRRQRPGRPCQQDHRAVCDACGLLRAGVGQVHAKGDRV